MTLLLKLNKCAKQVLAVWLASDARGKTQLGVLENSLTKSHGCQATATGRTTSVCVLCPLGSNLGKSRVRGYSTEWVVGGLSDLSGQPFTRLQPTGKLATPVLTYACCRAYLDCVSIVDRGVVAQSPHCQQQEPATACPHTNFLLSLQRTQTLSNFSLNNRSHRLDLLKYSPSPLSLSLTAPTKLTNTLAVDPRARSDPI